MTRANKAPSTSANDVNVAVQSVSRGTKTGLLRDFVGSELRPSEIGGRCIAAHDWSAPVKAAGASCTALSLSERTGKIAGVPAVRSPHAGNTKGPAQIARNCAPTGLLHD